MMNIADIFEAAADDVFEHGIVKGTYGVKGGPRCATGHLSTYTAEDRDDTRDLWADCYSALAWYLVCTKKVIGAETVKGSAKDVAFDVVIHWNDDPLRTSEEVREAFLHTAKGLRA